MSAADVSMESLHVCNMKNKTLSQYI